MDEFHKFRLPANERDMAWEKVNAFQLFRILITPSKHVHLYNAFQTCTLILHELSLLYLTVIMFTTTMHRGVQ